MQQLRLTTSEPYGMFSLAEINPLIVPKDVKEFIKESTHAFERVNIYIHGEAEELAGFDIPLFIDGDLLQMKQPIAEQDILLLLPNSEYKCKAEFYKSVGVQGDCYLITLFNEPSVNIES